MRQDSAAERCESADMSVLELAVSVAVLAFVVVRPRGLNEAWPAAGGAAALLAIGVLRPGDLVAVARETAGVLAFLAGMMAASGVAEQAGVFRWAASLAARTSGTGRRLMVNVFLLGAAVTALLSLDTTVIILTPVIYATVMALGLDPLPYLYACTFVANTGSLIFPMSNLTNLLVVSRLGLPFWRFAAAMALPNAAAVAVNIGVFLWLFRDRLPGPVAASAVEPDATRAPSGDAASRAFFRAAAATLALLLLGLFAAGLADRPLWPAAVLGGAAMLVAGRAAGVSAAASALRGISWPLFVFVWAMAAIVRGVERAGPFAGLAHLLAGSPPGSPGGLAAAAGIAAAGANLFNNIPMTLLALPVLAAVGHSRAFGLAAAVLIGVNIGPALTPAGSLATIIWLSVVRRQGLQVPALEYLKVAAVTVPLALAAAIGVLALEGGLR
jgi:arsenical pump membrane protein